MIDITQELFSSAVYPGDTPPSFRRVRTAEADGYMLTDLSLCAHNGTHIDAPAHFIPGGKAADELDLSRCIGRCLVFEGEGELAAADVECIFAERVLFKGNCTLREEAAYLLRERCLLVGTESQSIGSDAVHRILLSAEVAVLEGLRLQAAAAGEYYTLIALPLKLGGCDGAPVRAVLQPVSPAEQPASPAVLQPASPAVSQPASPAGGEKPVSKEGS